MVMMLFALGIAFAQQTIKGVVTDRTSEPIIGASIVVKGTTTGTITDIDGQYTLSVPDNAKTLVFSYIGMKPLEVAIKGNVINASLEESTQDLDEVVVVGYGVQRKRDLTGSVSSVGEKALKDIPVTSAAEAITGRMAGVQVTTTEGSPDAEITIRIRGGGSVSQDNSPLYIVDGFPVSTISNIPPSDIQSIDVLKDASSTAIYGARGANGVVIITTKSGKEGKVSVSFNSFLGMKKNARELPVLNPHEYVLYQYEIDQSQTFQNYYGAYDDLDIYRSMQGTNWQEEVFGRTALQQYYNVGINGGNKQTKYNLSLTRNDEEAIMIGSDFERNNLNFKITTEVSKTVSVDFNTRLSYTVVNGAGVSSGSGSNTKLRNAVKYAPTLGLREFGLDDDDEINTPEQSSNLFDPVESTLDEYKKQKRFVSTNNGALNWKITKPLTFRSEFGYEIGYNNTDQVWGPSTSTSRQLGGLPLARLTKNEYQQWRVANTLTFDKRNFVPKMNINVMVGQELVSRGTKSMDSESRFFPLGMTPEDILAMMNLGQAIPTTSKFGQDDNLASFFGRVNYNAYDRYMLSVTFRADGSSKFAAGNQWGYFPSAAFAWRINDEAFMANTTDYLSNLKLRLSYGAAGNNRIPDGLWQMTWNTSQENKPYFPGGPTIDGAASQLIPGNTLTNPDLKWETTLTRNLGIDYGFFNNRLSGTIDLYWNTTKDLLIEAPLPASTGFTRQMRNEGQTSNKGIELLLEGTIIDTKDWTVSASANIAFNKNNVDKFQNGDVNFKTYTSGWNGSAAPTEDYILQQGQPIGQMYGWVTDGYYSFDQFTFNNTTNRWNLNAGEADNSGLTSAGSYFGPGALRFKDLNGDGVIDDKDKKVIGRALPKNTGGFNLMARWKQIDMSMMFNWSYGNQVYNANKLDYTCQLLSRRYQNLSTEMSLDRRFTTIDPATGNNIYHGANANPQLLRELNEGKEMWMPLHTTTVLHSWAVEDASFLRLNNLTVGYTLPSKFTKKFLCQSLRVYFTGYNLWTITGYTGFDPEVNTRRSTPLTPSVDYSAYPKARSYIGGINVSF